MPSLKRKFEKLQDALRSYERVVVAFSGGCDSALVAKAARLVLGRERMRAVTAHSESLPQYETKNIESFVMRYDIEHAWIQTEELQDSRYAHNPKNRCYFCKTELYGHLFKLAASLGFPAVANGTNCDDFDDWRPGLHAAEEFGVKSPLVEAGLNKEEVRALSRELGLETWDKPAAACLSSRIPYGQEVTPEKLRQIDAGEAVLKGHGFRVVRLRHFGGRARIEVGRSELERFEKNRNLWEAIVSQIQAVGFREVELDPDGYRQGKLNA